MLALAATLPAAAAASPVPEVFRDEFIAIHAGIPDAAIAPRHIGDKIEFVLQVELASPNVRVEELDAGFFQRSFAAVTAFHGSEAPRLSTSVANGNKVMTAVWSFQVIDCPDSRVACPGSKHYSLPPLSLAYEVLDESGQLLNNRSARFRPWPGELMISPVISTSRGTAGDLTEFFPGGAFPDPVIVATHQSGAVLGIVGGLLLIALSYAPLARTQRRSFRPTTAPTHTRRWEQLFATLPGSDLADDRWADALRRCVTQYCQDELNINPYQWLDSAARDSGAPGRTHDEWRALFADVLQYEAVAGGERTTLIARFNALAELSRTDSKPGT